VKSVTNEVGAVAIRGATDWEFEVLEHRGYRRGFYPLKMRDCIPPLTQGVTRSKIQISALTSPELPRRRLIVEGFCYLKVCALNNEQ
jgi:hypothetical protein